MKIVMVAKQKGGVGATTLARELGVAAAAAGKSVVLVDLDPQGYVSGAGGIVVPKGLRVTQIRHWRPLPLHGWPRR